MHYTVANEYNVQLHVHVAIPTASHGHAWLLARLWQNIHSRVGPDVIFMKMAADLLKLVIMAP